MTAGFDNMPLPAIERSTRHAGKFAGTNNPRHLRVLALLLQRPATRGEVDRVAGCANGPDLIDQLRDRGLDLPCIHIKALDRDGRVCRPGIYSLTPADRRKVLRWLSLRAASHGAE